MGGLPTKQPVAAFASDPTSTPVMFAALPGALWTSRDGAKTWQQLAKVPGGITALAVHPTSSDTVFAGTRDGRVFMSSDGGTSWHASR